MYQRSPQNGLYDMLQFSFLPIPEFLFDEKYNLSLGAVYLFGIIAKVNREEVKWSRTYLAERLRCSTREIHRRVKELEEAGFIKVDRPGGSSWNIYKVNISLIINKQHEDKTVLKDTAGPGHEDTSGPPRSTDINKIDKIDTASLSDAAPQVKVKSENWLKSKEYIKTNLEKWKGLGYNWPTKEGVYDWRFLLNHGDTTPDKLIGALYWECKQKNTEDSREFTSKEKAWESFRQEQKMAVKLANLFTPDEFREKLEEVVKWTETFKDPFDWKLSTVLKRLND